MIFEHSSKAKLYYNIIGTGKISILFLHGFCASCHTWDYILHHFDKKKYTLVFVDLLGHGHSSIDESTDYSLNSQPEGIYDFMNFLQIKDFIIIGHSYGGSIALLLSLLYLKELSIKKLILIDAGAYADEIPFFIRHLHNPFIKFLHRSPQLFQKILQDILF
jgi:pimeloyl-ACP methyl ester carboxylesterase